MAQHPDLVRPSLTPERDQALFFEQLEEGFHRAAARCGEVVRDFRVAGTAVRIRFAGEGLVESIAPGLAFPVAELPAGPRCEILVWDSETTGVMPVAPPRPHEDFTTRGNIWGFDSPRYRSAYQWGEGSVNLMDLEARRAIYWVPSSRHLPAWVLSCPLRSILHWWLAHNGHQLVHGAVVGDGGRGVLMPGQGGAGKSSTSLACLAHGLQFIGDDYVALAFDPAPRAYSLYATAKLDRRSLERYPELAARCRAVESPGFEKAVLFLRDGFADNMPESLPVRLVLTPRISGQPETTLGLVDAGDVEWALSSGTLVHLPHVNGQTVRFLSRMAQQVPHSMLNLGTDPAGIVHAIREAAAATGPVLPAEAHDHRPFVTVIVHLREEDAGEWEPLRASLDAQHYGRVEALVTIDHGARPEEEKRRVGGVHLQVHTFDHRMPTGAAWNRAIRESFAECLLFLEPGDRLVAGALETWVRGAGEHPEAAWIAVRTSNGGRRWLVRKGAFRTCGLFDPHPAQEGKQVQQWLANAAAQGLTGVELEAVLVRAPQAAGESRTLLSQQDLRRLKESLDRRRQQMRQA
ncbi:hypothetical protein [Paludibaculum fermentans]|uniref:HPr kinase n=1 Tax=Paludibaculum fermentans TaxID=1473598 RepID=A0A7S7NPT2_PALFE|nr:hypothetical protein [Paludibaculum fermentans]QOY87560.1 hypothetical protein IRI77_33205 [Paludibaculum fermentans]